MATEQQHTALAVVPAAGIGRRMRSDLPKQYLPLAGRTVIEHTLQVLLDSALIERVIVGIGAGMRSGIPCQSPLILISRL